MAEFCYHQVTFRICCCDYLTTLRIEKVFLSRVLEDIQIGFTYLAVGTRRRESVSSISRETRTLIWNKSFVWVKPRWFAFSQRNCRVPSTRRCEDVTKPVHVWELLVLARIFSRSHRRKVSVPHIFAISETLCNEIADVVMIVPESI